MTKKNYIMKKLMLPFTALVICLASWIPPNSTTYTIDTKASKLKWTGYHLAKSYEHTGFVSLKSGSLTTDGEKITGGEFVIDMKTITNTDLTDKKKNAQLVDHLKSDDFFNVKTYPTAKLVIKGSERVGENTYKTTADLTIRDVTKTIEFETKILKMTDTEIEATADFNVKRTDFKVMYGWKLENIIISGEFRMEVSLKGKRSE
jgi:polyisoprenoid-binding protein YceI